MPESPSAWTAAAGSWTRSSSSAHGRVRRRSLEHEEVYLHAYETVADAKAGIGRWINFYNEERPHQALAYATPAAVYRQLEAVDMMDIAAAMTTSM